MTKLINIVFGLFALLLLPLNVAAENIEADNFDCTFAYDYGEVAVGDEGTYIFTVVATLGPVDYVGTSIEGDSAFQITSISYPQDPMWDGDTLEVEVAFAPATTGEFSANLEITTDATNYDCGIRMDDLDYTLVGTGVAAPTPDDMMLDLIDFYDEAIAEGWLSGRARGQSGTSTDAVFRDMLFDIYDLIVAGNDRKACRELSKTMLRIDGVSSPPDLVTGDVAPVVYGMLTEVFVALGCD